MYTDPNIPATRSELDQLYRISAPRLADLFDSAAPCLANMETARWVHDHAGAFFI